ncbi:MAG TPA: tripartite tricarboxylate transporter substrate-binding protein, partial [Ramlibacter sp.]
ETPRPIVARLGDEIVKAMRSPDLAKRFSDQGLDVAPMGPAQFAPFVDSEISRWAKVIRDAGIKLE